MKRQKGQTLIEVLISLIVASTIVTAITFSVVSSLKNSQFVKNQSTATEYAQQGIEIVNNARLQNYGSFSNLSGTYCLSDNCTTLSTTQNDSCGPPIGKCQINVPQPSPTFIRQALVQQSAPNCTGPSQPTQAGTLVTVSVSWTDGQCTNGTYCHKVNNETCMTNYGQISTP